jgi:hypothetical protein
MDTPDSWLNDWRGLGPAEWQRWAGSLGLPGRSTAPMAGLHDAAAAFTRFAEEFASLARAAAAAPPAEAALRRAELEKLAQNFFARAVPSWPAWAGQGAEWTGALQAWSLALAEVARATAASFAARLAAPDRPATLRATFDAWIDCAEAAFQSAAHSDGFASAQARLFNELVRAKARQQTLVEQLAKSAGVPTRSEVDALHDELRALKAELATQRTAAPGAAAPKATQAKTPAAARRRAPRKRPP